MSGFTIPNTPDAANQNQAEPDSLDFQILGNQKNGVVNGMAVTPGTGQAVAVANGEVLINGSYYTFSGDTSVELTNYVSTVFFDVIYARVSGGTVTCLSAPGTGGVGNPRYPSTGSGTGQINPDTDVVLASVWRTSSSAPTVGEITDKRIFVRSSTSRTNTDTISQNRGVEGDIYVNPAWTAPVGTGSLESAVSVKVGTTWYKLARYSENFSAGTIAANITGSAGSVPWSGITGVPDIAYNNVGGTYTMNITGHSGYLSPVYNVDPLDGWTYGTGYIGWSNALGSWSVSGPLYFGQGFYTYSTVTLPYINGYGSVTASGTPIVINSSNNLRKQSSSSRRFKENIQEYTFSDAVLSINPVTYDYKQGVLEDDLDRTGHFGLIAEDLHDAGLTYLVRYNNNGEVESIKYDLLSVELLGIVKKLSARIEALEAQ